MFTNTMLWKKSHHKEEMFLQPTKSVIEILDYTKQIDKLINEKKKFGIEVNRYPVTNLFQRSQ